MKLSPALQVPCTIRVYHNEALDSESAVSHRLVLYNFYYIIDTS